MHDYDTSWRIDPNTLRDHPNDPDEMRKAVQDLLRQKHNLGMAGALLRMLGELNEAQRTLEHALDLTDDAEKTLINRVRLAHVHQWQRDFERSNALFAELLAQVQQPAYARYEAWVSQHAAKNWFDQGEYRRALALFERAMTLRKVKGDAERIQSTQLGLDACRRQLA